MIKKFILTFIVIFFARNAFAEISLPPRPYPAKFVNDYTNTLKPNEINQLENKLESYANQSANEVAIVVIKSTDGYEISDYAVQLGRKWGIGKKDKNNGVLILWAKDDRKIFIATGYGVEGDLPDATVKGLIEKDIIPDFKTGNYYNGLDLATNDIIKIISGDIQLKNRISKTDTNEPGSGGIIFIILYIIIFILLARKRIYLIPTGLYSSRGFSSGSGFGGGFGGGSFGGGGAGGRY